MHIIKRRPEFDDWFEGLRDRQTRFRLLRRLEKAQRGLLGDVAPVGGGVFMKCVNFSVQVGACTIFKGMKSSS